MTNKEMINSLSDRELLRFFHRVFNCKDYCMLEDSGIDTKNCRYCDGSFLRWFQLESDEVVWERLLVEEDTFYEA